MATTYTENYHLGKQENHADKFRMDVITANMDIIDEQIKKNEDEIASAKGTYTTLSERLSNIEAVQDSPGAALDEDRAALVELVDGGSKNLLKITASSQTIKGVTFTVNDDQTVTVNGTNNGTGPATFIIVPNAQVTTIPDGKYILSGCPAGGGTSSYDLRWYLYSPGKSAYDVGAGFLVEKSGNTTDSNIAIVVKEGQTANNLVFKPMICSKADWDISQVYQPYAMSNAELTAAIQALQAQLANQ